MRGRNLQGIPLSTTPNPLDQAIERCAQAPIQIPDSIQPQGFLLVLGERDLRIRQACENVDQWLDVSAQELLGQAFVAQLGDGHYRTAFRIPSQVVWSPAACCPAARRHSSTGAVCALPVCCRTSTSSARQPT